MLSAIRESPTQRPCLAHDKTWRKKCTIENFIHFTARDEFEELKGCIY
ncbi:unnamed protein product [Spirodela intermedia]|uniref:Uncharacterized protein n=1 Tax=Spirodela intermedia TaxID=51605 RepID=A0A7I8IWL6_SPIIN|nr:unnamed protein product [Spirodela intermedia]CAA6661400.1 unnamed protein product [Spirodela intermedia]